MEVILKAVEEHKINNEVVRRILHCQDEVGGFEVVEFSNYIEKQEIVIKEFKNEKKALEFLEGKKEKNIFWNGLRYAKKYYIATIAGNIETRYSWSTQEYKTMGGKTIYSVRKVLTLLEDVEVEVKKMKNSYIVMADDDGGEASIDNNGQYVIYTEEETSLTCSTLELVKKYYPSAYMPDKETIVLNNVGMNIEDLKIELNYDEDKKGTIEILFNLQ